LLWVSVGGRALDRVLCEVRRVGKLGELCSAEGGPIEVCEGFACSGLRFTIKNQVTGGFPNWLRPS